MDDLADTICQVEALFIIWNLGETVEWNQVEEKEEKEESGRKWKINLSRGKEEVKKEEKIVKKEEGKNHGLKLIYG